MDGSEHPNFGRNPPGRWCDNERHAGRQALARREAPRLSRYGHYVTDRCYFWTEWPRNFASRRELTDEQWELLTPSCPPVNGLGSGFTFALPPFSPSLLLSQMTAFFAAADILRLRDDASSIAGTLVTTVLRPRADVGKGPLNRFNLSVKLPEPSFRTNPRQPTKFLFSHCALL